MRNDLLKRTAKPVIQVFTSECGEFCSLYCPFLGQKSERFTCTVWTTFLNPVGDSSRLGRCQSCKVCSE